MTTESDRGPRESWSGPLYLDASALAKLYLPEPGSDDLGAALGGRRDLVVSDLAVTEVTSAVARRRRDGALRPRHAAKLHAAVVGHADGNFYRRIDLAPNVHREAERLLLSMEAIPLRAADALHLALAGAAGAATVVTYDARMVEAAARIGFAVAP